jgi:hypothetical protein
VNPRGIIFWAGLGGSSSASQIMDVGMAHLLLLGFISTNQLGLVSFSIPLVLLYSALSLYVLLKKKLFQTIFKINIVVFLFPNLDTVKTHYRAKSQNSTTRSATKDNNFYVKKLAAPLHQVAPNVPRQRD